MSPHSDYLDNMLHDRLPARDLDFPVRFEIAHLAGGPGFFRVASDPSPTLHIDNRHARDARQVVQCIAHRVLLVSPDVRPDLLHDASSRD